MKKLLVLGGNHIEKDIVTHAQKMGYYVIVTDNHTDLKDSPAKQIANEGWNISWSDIDSLELKCIESGVNGIIAGFSEFRVENMIKLCERLELPCYLTKNQLDITRDKCLFKKELKKYNVPIVPEYKINDKIIFPVIVKPTDRAGSIGIRVAYNYEELKDSVEEAVSKSPTNSYIIEKYMDGCTKIDAYYVIINDQIHFVGSNDTLMCPPLKGHEVMQAAWLFPSFYENLYVKKVDAAFKNFLRGINIHNGYITLSAFVDSNENIFVFETGFRLSGELSYYYTERKYGINYLDYLIDYSMSTPLEKYSINVDRKSEIKCLSINFFGQNGSVSFVKYPNIKDDVFKNYIEEGDIITNHDSIIFKKIAMSISFGDDTKILKNTMDIINSYEVKTQDGDDLIYYKPEINQLKQFLEHK